MYKELAVSASIPESKLKRAFKSGTLSLTKDELSGSGATLHLHPESYAKALRARKAGKGMRLSITKKEIGYPFKHLNGGGMHGSSVWSKIWNDIKQGFRFAKDSGLLSKAADFAVPALATAVGAPEAGIPAHAALKSLTGVGVYDSDSDTELDKGTGATSGGRISVADVKKTTKAALGYAKRKGLITDAIDQGEKYLISKSENPDHHDMIHTVRRGIKSRFGVGVASKKTKLVKGSAEAKAYMANLRSKRKRAKLAGSFRL
ncbi:hypothetical protein P3T76_010453 [Phytophthora citrophthora]|uniref:Uncharacterized protein n=1 Tax=Phytophthora citrophthora TaxID=4793 RepID=A0AAD9GC24_9STRA|nr:hypothetical protein P3T76_010453 [Phytophthora citrophthora]